MEDDNFKVVRKNLNILSVLIMLLAFADAEINKINFLGIALDLEGEKVYMGIFLIYIYFIWRYLTKVNVPGEFWNKYFDYYRVKASKRFKKAKYFDKVNKIDGIQLEGFLEGELQIQKLSVTSQNRSFLNLQLDWSYNTQDDSRIRTVSSKKKVTPFYPILLFIWFCLRYDKFGDFLFPLIPVLLNLGFFLFNEDWQGSIHNYFLIEDGQPKLFEDGRPMISE